MTTRRWGIGLGVVLAACGGARPAPAPAPAGESASTSTSTSPRTDDAPSDPPPTSTTPATTGPRTAHPDIRSAGSTCTADSDCVVARGSCCSGCCPDDTLTAFSRADFQHLQDECAREQCPHFECGGEDCPPPRSRHGTAACVGGICVGVALVEE